MAVMRALVIFIRLSPLLRVDYRIEFFAECVYFGFRQRLQCAAVGSYVVFGKLPAAGKADALPVAESGQHRGQFAGGHFIFTVLATP
jgi:hypothetical protein